MQKGFRLDEEKECEPRYMLYNVEPLARGLNLLFKTTVGNSLAKMLVEFKKLKSITKSYNNRNKNH